MDFFYLEFYTRKLDFRIHGKLKPCTNKVTLLAHLNLLPSQNKPLTRYMLRYVASKYYRYPLWEMRWLLGWCSLLGVTDLTLGVTPGWTDIFLKVGIEVFLVASC